jgi:GTPase SAR1 family protein
VNANKSDLEAERTVSREQGDQLARNYNIAFFETSAKTRTNIEESFFQLGRMMLAKQAGREALPKHRVKPGGSKCVVQ